MNSEPEAIYNNRARLTQDEGADCTGYECCPEELVFAMQDTTHKFSLGLTTVLECLAIAEKQGYVPQFPREWWCRVHRNE